VSHIRSDELVADALRDSDAGMRDADNATKHGVTIKTIRRWRRLYQRRGLPRGQSHTSAACPRCQGSTLDEPAYAELFGWYLGDGWLETRRGGVYTLHIHNDVRYQDLNEEIQRLMRHVKPGGRPSTRLVPGCLITSVSWKHWICLLPQHGPGRKNERALHLADWQSDLLERYPAPFLAGLFHSDGCRVDNWATKTVDGVRRRYDYGRWQFVNHSPDIQHWCRDALDRLEIPWRQSNWKTISVSRREAVARLDELIGPKR
jgi:hypothetical protein